MKKLSTLLIAAALLVGACKKSDDAKQAPAKPSPDQPAAKPIGDQPAAKPLDPPPAAAAALAALDLSPVGDDWKGWSIQAPAGATVKESFGAAEVILGDGFQFDIRLEKADVAAYKKDQEANDINKLKGYVIDVPEAIVYESEVMSRTEFHFYGGVTVGDVNFACEDVKGPTHSKADAEAMWKACQSLAKK